MESEERLSTRDIAGGGDTATDRDPTLADTPPADTAAAPPDRADRDYDDGGAVAADRAANGDGDVVTDEPTGRGPSRESVADGAADDTADRPAPAAAAAAGSAAGDPAVRDTGAGDATTRDSTADATATGTAATGTGATAGGGGDDNPLLADAEGFQGRWEEIQVRFVDEPRGAVEDADARSWRRHAAPRRGLRPGARAPRGAVGPRRGHLDGGPARGAPALPLVLPPPAVHVVVGP